MASGNFVFLLAFTKALREMQNFFSCHGNNSIDLPLTNLWFVSTGSSMFFTADEIFLISPCFFHEKLQTRQHKARCLWKYCIFNQNFIKRQKLGNCITETSKCALWFHSLVAFQLISVCLLGKVRRRLEMRFHIPHMESHQSDRKTIVIESDACFIIEMCAFGITVFQELRGKHCGDNTNFKEILLLVSSTLYGTIYRFVSVLRWLHHVAVSHGVSTREKTLHTRFRESENLAWKTFRSLARRQQKFCEWKLFAARVQLSAAHPSDRTRLFSIRREILWNSNSQVQGGIFIKKVLS